MKGETNFVADALSRPSVSAIVCESAINCKDLDANQALDNEFTHLRLSTSSTLDFRLLKTSDDVSIWCDVSTGHARQYVTKKFRRKVFTRHHGLRHPSHRATKPLINSRFVWRGMNIDIAIWCRSCTGFQTAKVSRHNKPVFGKFDQPTERFDHVHVDLVGPLPYSDGFKYLLTCVDRFTRWPETIPLADVLQMPFSVGGWLVSGPLPLLPRIEVPNSNHDYRILCVINSASLEIILRVTTLSRMVWSNVFIASLKPLLWRTNHQTHGQLCYRQSYSAFNRPSRKH